MRKRATNEKGLSLIEVVASILLISIILLSFFGLFIQSNKAKITSSQTVDLTYYAQTEMDNLYTLTSGGTLASIGYTTISNSASIKTYSKTENNLTYKLTLKPVTSHKNLTQGLLEVSSGSPHNRSSKMETIFKWKVFE